MELLHCTFLQFLSWLWRELDFFFAWFGFLLALSASKLLAGRVSTHPYHPPT